MFPGHPEQIPVVALQFDENPEHEQPEMKREIIEAEIILNKRKEKKKRREKKKKKKKKPVQP